MTNWGTQMNPELPNRNSYKGVDKHFAHRNAT